jgi:hypothetical protein
VAIKMLVKGRRRPNEVSISRLEDFECAKGETVSPDIISGPEFTPYCFDWKRDLVVFTELPPGVCLSNATFAYHLQYERAINIVTMSREELLALPVTKNPAQIVFLYSTGRSGSTLILKMFNGIPSCYSVSEPDAFSDLSRLFHNSQKFDGRLAEALLWHYFKPVGRRPTHFVLKFRGHCSNLAPSLASLFPSSIALFNYRNPKDTIISWLLAFRSREMIENDPALNDVIRTRTFEWCNEARFYLAQRKKGMKIKAIKYELLLEDPRRVFEDTLQHCQLSSPENLNDAVATMSKHSQDGTEMQRRSLSNKVLEKSVSRSVEDLFSSIGWVETDPILLDTLGHSE